MPALLVQAGLESGAGVPGAIVHVTAGIDTLLILLMSLAGTLQFTTRQMAALIAQAGRMGGAGRFGTRIHGASGGNALFVLTVSPARAPILATERIVAMVAQAGFQSLPCRRSAFLHGSAGRYAVFVPAVCSALAVFLTTRPMAALISQTGLQSVPGRGGTIRIAGRKASLIRFVSPPCTQLFTTRRLPAAFGPNASLEGSASLSAAFAAVTPGVNAGVKGFLGLLTTSLHTFRRHRASMRRNAGVQGRNKRAVEILSNRSG